MTPLFKPALHSFAALVLLFGAGGLAFAQDRNLEAPPSFDPAKIPGIRASGENYTIANPVRSDGFLRIYVLKTPYGEFAVHGDDMLRMRLRELAAVAALEKASKSDAFNKALVEAGLSPLKYTGQLIVNPVKTIGDTLAGVGSLFGQIGSSINNAGKTDENAVAGALGVTRQRRLLAVNLGVDPYTDFEPLSAKLNQLSEAAAMGGLVVSGALMVIPGAAGIVVSNLSTANKLGDMRIEDIARDFTPSQIMDLNRQRLIAMGVDRALIETLLSNRNYTPVDMAAMVAALDSMSAVQGRTVFVARAATVNERSIAYFVRRHAEMTADYYAKTGGLIGYVSLGGYPFNQLRGGGVVAIMPVDIVSWSRASVRALNDSTADLKRSGIGGRAELWFAGRATRLAKRKLAALGWNVVENRK